jgi:hypothetical protein
MFDPMYARFASGSMGRFSFSTLPEATAALYLMICLN